MASAAPSGSPRRPARVMRTGTPSWRSGSSAASTLPADTQEIACSVLRPPKTMATRIRLTAQTLAPSAVEETHRSDEIRAECVAVADVGAGVRRLDHLPVADVHPDVVDGVGIAGVSGEEQQVAFSLRRHGDVRPFVPLVPRPVVDMDADLRVGPHDETGAVVGVRTGGAPLVGLAQLGLGGREGVPLGRG